MWQQHRFAAVAGQRIVGWWAAGCDAAVPLDGSPPHRLVTVSLAVVMGLGVGPGEPRR